MKRRFTPSRRLVNCPSQRTLLAEMLGSKQIESSLKAILYAQTNSIWRGLGATPPSSLLEEVVAEFKCKTSIPLELPFMSTLSLAAEYMAEQGASIRLSDHQTILLDLYSLVLASSGRCKSWTYKVIHGAAKNAGWTPRPLDEPISSAAFVEVIAEAEGKPVLWRLEEMGEFWVTLQGEAHRMTKRYLLMLYDHDPITYRVKSKGLKENGVKKPEKVEVCDSCLSIYGTSVLENLHKQVTTEDWRSGLIQRFAFLVAKDDPARPWFEEQYAFLDRINFAVLSNAWQKALQTPVCVQYELTEPARKAIARMFFLLGRDSGLGEDFVRRIEFRVFKYAAVYHWIAGKNTPLIDAEDVGWGARLAIMHVEDLKFLLDETEYNDYLDLFTRAVKLREKLGANFSPRTIRMYLRHIVRNQDEAHAIYRLVQDYPGNQGQHGIPARVGIMSDLHPASGGPYAGSATGRKASS